MNVTTRSMCIVNSIQRKRKNTVRQTPIKMYKMLFQCCFPSFSSLPCIQIQRNSINFFLHNIFTICLLFASFSSSHRHIAERSVKQRAHKFQPLRIILRFLLFILKIAFSYFVCMRFRIVRIFCNLQMYSRSAWSILIQSNDFLSLYITYNFLYGTA